ncbi:MAG TPA: hypothetical protein VLJ83_05175 [Gemmatimonadaceae bacterium]|nr:hypothetical protein [Gemmatimonadaceae bacterium]
MDIHAETAFERAKRDYRALATNTVRFLVWIAVWDAAVVGATAYLTSGHSARAQAGISVAAFVVGTAIALLLPFGTIWVTAPVRQRDEVRMALATLIAHGDAISVEFTRQPGGILRVGLKNDGARIHDAAINVLVPKRDGIRIYRREKGGTVAPGSVLETPEELEPGVPSIYWEETGLDIYGFGTSTLLRFVVGLAQTPMAIKFKLGCDEWGGWREWAGVVESLDKETEDSN